MLLDMILRNLQMVGTVDMGERTSLPQVGLSVHAAVTTTVTQRSKRIVAHVIGCERGIWLSVWSNCR